MFCSMACIRRSNGARPNRQPATRIGKIRFMTADVNATIDAVYRADWGRIVAALIRITDDFDVAEEAAQEAFASAVQEWPKVGIPDSPRAWIIQTARHKAIDRIRRQTHLREIVEAQVAAGAIRTVEESV